MKTCFNGHIDTADYLDKVDLTLIPGEKEIEETLQKRLLKSHITLKMLSPEEPIRHDDMVTISTESELPKFNKSRVMVTVGSGLYDKELEACLVGKCLGESLVVTTQGIEVKVVVIEVKRKEVPPITDAMVVEQGIEGVDTIDQYRTHLTKELMDYTYGPITGGLIASLVELAKMNEPDASDLEILGKLEVDFFRGFFKQEKGLNLDEMTSEEMKENLGCESIDKFVEMRQEWYKMKAQQCLVMSNVLGIALEGENDPTNNYNVHSELMMKMIEYVKTELMRRKSKNGSTLC